MIRFLKYFCAYCLARLMFDAGRAALRSRKRGPVGFHQPPCKKHGQGVLLAIVLLPFMLSAVLIVIGFVVGR